MERFVVRQCPSSFRLSGQLRSIVWLQELLEMFSGFAAAKIGSCYAVGNEGGENMRAVWILGTGVLGVIAIRYLLSPNRRAALNDNQLEAKVHRLKRKFKSLDEVQYDAAVTGGNDAGFAESLRTPPRF
jgi:hypothetical protein